MRVMDKIQTCQTRYEHLLRRFWFTIRLSRWPLLAACVGEFAGTIVLIIMGTGVIAQQELGNKGNYEHGGFVVIPLTWGIAVMLAVFTAGTVGNGNTNPAVTLAYALIGRVPFIRVLPYILSQILGAFVGALVVIGIYREAIYEKDNLLSHGVLSMITTGKIFVTRPHITHGGCFLDQMTGTALLVGLALVIVDSNNFNLPKQLEPIYLGLMVTGLVAAFAMNAGAALNPARDFGPRCALAITGWGAKAFTDEDYYFWIPIIAPFLGGTIGAFAYMFLVGAHLPNAFRKELMKEENSESGDKELEYEDESSHYPLGP